MTVPIPISDLETYHIAAHDLCNLVQFRIGTQNTMKLCVSGNKIIFKMSAVPNLQFCVQINSSFLCGLN